MGLKVFSVEPSLNLGKGDYAPLARVQRLLPLRASPPPRLRSARRGSTRSAVPPLVVASITLRSQGFTAPNAISSLIRCDYAPLAGVQLHDMAGRESQIRLRSARRGSTCLQDGRKPIVSITLRSQGFNER